MSRRGPGLDSRAILFEQERLEFWLQDVALELPAEEQREYKREAAALRVFSGVKPIGAEVQQSDEGTNHEEGEAAGRNKVTDRCRKKREVFRPEQLLHLRRPHDGRTNEQLKCNSAKPNSGVEQPNKSQQADRDHAATVGESGARSKRIPATEY